MGVQRKVMGWETKKKKSISTLKCLEKALKEEKVHKNKFHKVWESTLMVWHVLMDQTGGCVTPAQRERAKLEGRLWAELLRKVFFLLFYLGYRAAFLHHVTKPHWHFLSKFFSPVPYNFPHSFLSLSLPYGWTSQTILNQTYPFLGLEVALSETICALAVGKQGRHGFQKMLKDTETIAVTGITDRGFDWATFPTQKCKTLLPPTELYNAS